MHRLKRWQAIVAAIVGGAIAAGGSIAITLIAAIAMLATGASHDIASAAQSMPVLFIGLASTSGLLLLTALATPLLARVRPKEALGLGPAPLVAFIAAPIGTLALGPTSDAMVHLVERVAPHLSFGALPMLQHLIEGHSLWLLVPVIAVLPGFCEEMFFRGMFQRGIGRGAGAVIASGVAFAAYHLDPPQAAGVLPLGLYFAWLAQRTDSTWVTIACHVTNNTMALIAATTQAAGATGGDTMPSPWLIAGGLCVAAIAAAVVFFVTRDRHGAPPPDGGSAAPTTPDGGTMWGQASPPGMEGSGGPGVAGP